ncbi:HNH endonuclease signature motif containing protein [Zunongwangia sp. F363]|uniref:HNH endonuclease signature motif containing protein n=1 Tax=Autumnicola tepida TaxID=3075595 RepID=A0ABU3CFE3_9FLAO|nr:HNH endonuclease signature motif containing protein [Zunongwangia sp. F363]MDT0644952.1 HNH endonuclease signature motif containing protein [Zunongwangia sp. F363]
MKCTKGRVNPNAHTKLKLFADSGGYCQNPNCNENLFLSIGKSEIHIAEMAHIISDSDTGPRSDKDLSKDKRSTFSNLILLCPTCHTKIDKAEKEFPEKIIIQWKNNHSERIKNLFKIREYDNRFETRKNIVKILNENKTIFKTYGPLTEERFNPESNVPKIWLSKIRQIILPNNRKLLGIIDGNYSKLKEFEIETVELFRQHVLDLEDRHINSVEINATQFPKELNNIFKD